MTARRPKRVLTEAVTLPPAGTRMSTSSLRQWLLAAGLLAAVFLAYQPAWHGGLLWDDDGHITAPRLRGSDGLKRIWLQPGATQQYYPLVHSAFWFQHRLWGDTTLGYHIVNIGLHVVSAFLLIAILRRLGVRGALVAGMLFALHPVHAESVAWITELKNVLSGAWFFAATLAYLKFDETGKRGPYWLAFGFFTLAVLSKTVTAVLPAALLVVLWWQRGRLQWRHDVRPTLPFFAIGIAAGLATAWVERRFIGAAGGTFDLSIAERCLVAGRAMWFYVGKLLWPANLSFIYPRWQLDSTSPVQWLYPIGIAAAAAVAWQTRKRSRAPLAAVLLYGGLLFPALGFVNVFPFRYSFVADHFQYLASTVPIAALASVIVIVAGGRNRRDDGSPALDSARAREGLRYMAWRNRGTPQDVTEAAIAVLIGLPLALLTWQQSHIYANAETLYRSTLERNPSCWLCHNNLATLELDQANPDVQAALARIEEGLRINPQNEEGHNNRGAVLRRLGRNDEAIVEYAEAVRLSPNFFDARMNLAVALRDAGRFDESLANLEHLLRLNPGSADAHVEAGSVLLSMGRLNEAIVHLQIAVEVQPDRLAAWNNLGLALARSDRLPEAVARFQHAVRLAPNDAGSRNNLGAALARLGRSEEAITEYRESLRLDPRSAKTHDNLGYLLLRQGRRAEAAPHFEEALRLQPDYAPTHVNVGNLLMDAGRPAEAITHYNAALQKPDEIDLAQVHSNLGVAFAMTGRRGLAIRHFNEALRIRPGFAQARANLKRALEGK